MRVETGTKGSEPDPFGRVSDPPGRRQLVQFWGFCEVDGEKWALVDYYQKYVPPKRVKGGPEPVRLWKHPLTVRYHHQREKRGDVAVPPFYAVRVSCITAAACVFPGVDQGWGVGSSKPGRRVFYFPPQLEVCGGEDWRLSSKNLVTFPTGEDLAECGECEDVSCDSSSESEYSSESSSSSSSCDEDD